jgi:hypothetical protein
MSIQTEKGTYTLCEKCDTIQLVQKVKHYIDYSCKPEIICLVGCKECRDRKLDIILKNLIER